MLKGMKGYQLTASDLDFLKKMQEEKLINKLQVLFLKNLLLLLLFGAADAKRMFWVLLRGTWRRCRGC